MAHPETAGDPRFSTLPARLQHHDESDELMAGWTREEEHCALMHTLQGAVIAAQAVLSTAEVLDDPHYAARGFFQAVAHPEAGTHPHVSTVAHLSEAPLPIRRPAPCLGEHNSWVLGGLLGAPKETLRRLEKAGKMDTLLDQATPD